MFRNILRFLTYKQNTSNLDFKFPPCTECCMLSFGCSETSAYKFQTPGNHPKESIQHSVQGESLKLRLDVFCFKLKNVKYLDGLKLWGDDWPEIQQMP